MDEPKKAKLGLLLLAGIISAAAALLVFGWLAEEALEADTNRFDEVVRNSIHQFASPPLTSLMQVVTLLGSLGVLVAVSVVAIILFLHFHRPRPATLLALTMAGAVLLDVVLKHAFHRARPAAFFGTSPISYSFPSGHALGSLCFYAAWAAILSARTSSRTTRWLIWSVAALLVGLIGFSRIYLGVHYPSDVIAGYCAALVWMGAIAVVEGILRSRVTKGPEPSANTSKSP